MVDLLLGKGNLATGMKVLDAPSKHISSGRGKANTVNEATFIHTQD